MNSNSNHRFIHCYTTPTARIYYHQPQQQSLTILRKKQIDVTFQYQHFHAVPKQHQQSQSEPQESKVNVAETNGKLETTENNTNSTPSQIYHCLPNQNKQKKSTNTLLVARVGFAEEIQEIQKSSLITKLQL